ncbi:hypothetical protein ACV566_09600 [Staphylococcus aureus]
MNVLTHPIKEYFAGVDWGYEHDGSIVLIGRGIDGNFYLLRSTHTNLSLLMIGWLLQKIL